MYVCTYVSVQKTYMCTLLCSLANAMYIHYDKLKAVVLDSSCSLTCPVPCGIAGGMN